MKKIYHYTTIENLQKILSTGQFFASTLTTSDDSKFGPGWYFTPLHPQTPDEIIAKQCWLKDDLEHDEGTAYLVFEIHDSVIKRCREDVFKLDYHLVNDHLLINQTYVSNATPVIKFVEHGYRVKKKIADVKREESLLATANTILSQKARTNQYGFIQGNDGIKNPPHRNFGG